jgi:hypothetical protein
MPRPRNGPRRPKAARRSRTSSSEPPAPPPQAETAAPPASDPIALTAADVARANFDGPSHELFARIQAYRRQAHLGDAPPPVLYHYTTSRGLLGILEHNTLWATHIGYLNDASELRYACDMVRAALRARRDAEKSPLAAEVCEQSLTSFNLADALGVYVACFCEKGDLLSQWRGYAGAGEGYSIGVRSRDLMDLGGYGLKFFLGRVEYDRAKQQEIIDTILSMTLDGLASIASSSPRAQTAALTRMGCKVFQQSIWYALVTFKDALFESEHEWRAIRLVEPAKEAAVVRMRAAGGQLIPYLELDFEGSPWRKGGKFPVAEVYHGPTLNPQLAKKSLDLLLTKMGHAAADTHGSRIPLRVVGS